MYACIFKTYSINNEKKFQAWPGFVPRTFHVLGRDATAELRRLKTTEDENL